MFPNELVVIGVHSAKFPGEQLTANIQQAVQRLGIQHPVINDAGFRVWNEYAVRAWPTLVLVDPRGRVVTNISGEILAEDLAKEIRNIIDAHPQEINREPLDLPTRLTLEFELPLRYPSKLLWVSGSPERLFIADTGHNRILEVHLDPEGHTGEVVRAFGAGRPGMQEGHASEAAFHGPHGMALRGDTLYVADTENHAIRAIDLSSEVVRTVAGTGQKAHGAYSLGPPTEVPLRSPWALAALEQYLLIAMAGSHQIWVLIDENQIGPFAGNGYEALVDGLPAEASFNQPSDLAFGLSHLFVADSEASAIRAVPLSTQAQTITLVGQGLFEFGDRDGTGSEVRLQHPTGLAFSESDNLLYIADTYNNKIKTLDPSSGEVRTLIGTGQPGYADGEFGESVLYEPEGVQVAGEKLYITDTNNHLIRVADLSTRQLDRLVLKGLERFSTFTFETDFTTPTQQPASVDPIQVAPGNVELVLDLTLPPGYHLNADGPSTLHTELHGQAYTAAFQAPDAARLTLPVSEPVNLPLDLTLLYCEDGDKSGLCLVHDRRLVIPIELDTQAPSRQVISYTVESPE